MANKGHFRYKNKRENRLLERTMLFVAIAEPLMTIPQIVELFSHPGEGHIAIATWILYITASSVWLIYGVYHRNRPLIFTGSLWVIMDSLVIIGALY